MKTLQVCTGNVKTPHHPNHLSPLKIIDDGQRQQVIFHKEFLGSIQSILGSQRLYVASHQVCGKNQRRQGRGLRGKIDFLNIDHAQEPVPFIHHGQDGVWRFA